MKVLVCGGRDYDDYATVCHTLNNCFSVGIDVDVLIHGDAPGADSMAKDWAWHHHIPTLARATGGDITSTTPNRD